MTEICRLCQQNRELQISHIVPRFVWRWLKTSSPTGYLRDSSNPNRRIQDGWKTRLLCVDCENIFSSDEKIFAERFFLPLHRNEQQQFTYERWALRFTVSVLWRVLTINSEGRLQHLSASQLSKARKTENVWREFLLGVRPHPGEHRVHVIPLDVIESHTISDMSPFMNRYLLRGVDVDVVAGSTDVFVYAKLCRVLIVGFSDIAKPQEWQGGRLNLKGGTIGGAVKYRAPEKLYHYMNSRADLNADALARMSASQKEKLRTEMEQNIGALAKSEMFRAMEADVNHSGRRAFDVTRAPNEAE